MQRIIALASIAALLGSGCALPRATPATFSIAHAQARAIRDAADPRDLEDRRKYISNSCRPARRSGSILPTAPI